MKLDLRYPNFGRAEALVLYDRATGEVLPGQVSGEFTYGVDQMSRVTVVFNVDGDDIALGDNRETHQQKADAAMEAEDARNDLQAALAAYGALSDDNRKRFQTAISIHLGIPG